MAALGDWSAVTGSWNRELVPTGEVKCRVVHFPESAGADATDTFTVNLESFGCTYVLGVVGFDETTEGSVSVNVQPTTSVTSKSLTITIGSGGDNRARTFVIWMR